MVAAIQRLQQLQGAGSRDPKEVSEAIHQLELAHGSPVMQGVRLDVLRQSLLVADRMKTLATELSVEQQAQGKSGQEVTPSMRAKMDQLEALQSQMRSDLMMAAPAGAAP